MRIFRPVISIQLLVLLLIASSIASAQSKKYTRTLIGFYNLENLFDTINQPEINDEDFTPAGANLYTPAVYLDKLSKLEEVISKIGTDHSPDGLALLGCAEIENESVLRDLADRPGLKKRNYKVVHFNSPDDRGVDVGLLYNPSYFKVISSASLYVPLKNDDGTPRFTRDILYVHGLLQGESFHVFVNHWPSRRGGEQASAPGRALAASIARAHIDSIFKSDPDAKIVLMGDLNDDPVSPSVAKVLGAKTDTAQVKRSDLYNPWYDYYKEGIGTLAYNDAWNLFDQIIISQSFLNKSQDGLFLQRAEIFKREFMLQTSGRYKGYPKRTYDFSIYMGGYSDHFPTYLILLKEKK